MIATLLNQSFIRKFWTSESEAIQEDNGKNEIQKFGLSTAGRSESWPIKLLIKSDT